MNIDDFTDGIIRGAPTFPSARLKLARAREHLRVVAEIASKLTFIDGWASLEDDPDGKMVWLVVRLPTPPAALGVMIGDVLFNVRSALDHIVSRLVRANGNELARSNMLPL